MSIRLMMHLIGRMNATDPLHLIVLGPFAYHLGLTQRNDILKTGSVVNRRERAVGRDQAGVGLGQQHRDNARHEYAVESAGSSDRGDRRVHLRDNAEIEYVGAEQASHRSRDVGDGSGTAIV